MGAKKQKPTIIYRITVTNWSKHNPNIKRSHKYSMISHNFCYDSKLQELPISYRWLFLGLVLICGSNGEDTMKISERSLKDLLKTGGRLEEALTALKLFQLVSYDVFEIPLNRIDRIDRIESTSFGESDERKEPGASSGDDFLPLDLIWNEECGQLPKVRALTKSRKTKILSLAKKIPEETYWRDIVRRVAKSSFCLGESGRGWRANFDWFIKPDTHVKVFEGHYDNKTQGSSISGMGEF